MQPPVSPQIDDVATIADACRLLFAAMLLDERNYFVEVVAPLLQPALRVTLSKSRFVDLQISALFCCCFSFSLCAHNTNLRNYANAAGDDRRLRLRAAHAAEARGNKRFAGELGAVDVQIFAAGVYDCDLK